MCFSVKLLSGSLSHENPGNQFGRAAAIFTIIFLVITAVLQIICLNRGLKVYDSTLVVPVFYGVYTAFGQVLFLSFDLIRTKGTHCRWLDSLIFNDEVEAYKSWTLFLIFISIIVLISGVVLLTFKKPEPVAGKIKSANSPRDRRRRKGDRSKRAVGDGNGEVNDEEQAQGSENDVLWAVGDASDDEDEDEDEDVDHHQHPLHQDLPKSSTVGGSPSQRRSSRRAVNERTGLVASEDEGDGGDYMDGSRLMDTNRKRSMDPFRDDDERHEMHSVAGEVNGRPLR